jgi:hypothetical protein
VDTPLVILAGNNGSAPAEANRGILFIEHWYDPSGSFRAIDGDRHAIGSARRDHFRSARSGQEIPAIDRICGQDAQQRMGQSDFTHGSCP